MPDPATAERSKKHTTPALGPASMDWLELSAAHHQPAML